MARQTPYSEMLRYIIDMMNELSNQDWRLEEICETFFDNEEIFAKDGAVRLTPEGAAAEIRALPTGKADERGNRVFALGLFVDGEKQAEAVVETGSLAGDIFLEFDY